MKLARSLQLVGLTTLIASSCFGDPTAPEDLVELTLTASPTAIALGESVDLLGVAFNPTPNDIVPISGCAPGIGFYVRDESGVEISLYAGWAFTCEGKDSQLISPGETDSVRFNWVPSAPGAYQVRAALLFGGMRSPSAPDTITIR